MLHPRRFSRVTRPGARSALTLAAPLLVILACLSCASSGQSGPLEPPANAQTVGEGECWVEVLNRTSGRVELYYWVGLGNPPNNRLSWSTVGFLPVERTVVIRASCDQGYVRVTALMRGNQNPSNSRLTLIAEERLSNTRRSVIRLRERS